MNCDHVFYLLYIYELCSRIIKHPTMRKDNLRGVRSVFLPQELIIEILLRLPVKSLVRFKCVCRLWLSLISDPSFAISHFEPMATHTKRLVFLTPRACEFRSIDFNASVHDDSASTALKLGFLPTKSYYVRILGSCWGFFTFLYGFGYDSSTDDYLVVQASNNPSLDDYTTRLEFFSLRANVCKELEVFVS
ncbi:hypothetical protein GLYMA_02G079600v4 [Glycine max]|nr:hypothetical protein GLYMA_02G079600v4 [Glycine max]KAH1059268.1 hypothetical protein GYH30_003357 [Glycine max]